MEIHKFDCGHEEEAQMHPIWGYPKKCSKCVKEYRKERSLKAKEQAHEEGLPKLIGTDKQVEWAETIRRTILNKFDKIRIAKVGSGYGLKISVNSKDKIDPIVLAYDSYSYFTKEEVKTFLEKLKSNIKRVNSAKAWIDMKENNIGTIITLYLPDEIIKVASLVEEFKVLIPKPGYGDIVIFNRDTLFQHVRQRFNKEITGQGTVIDIDKDGVILCCKDNPELPVRWEFIKYVLNKDNTEGMLCL